jgi:hypothetical protein
MKILIQAIFLQLLMQDWMLGDNDGKVIYEISFQTRSYEERKNSHSKKWIAIFSSRWFAQ